MDITKRVLSGIDQLHQNLRDAKASVSKLDAGVKRGQTSRSNNDGEIPTPDKCSVEKLLEMANSQGSCCTCSCSFASNTTAFDATRQVAKVFERLLNLNDDLIDSILFGCDMEREQTSDFVEHRDSQESDDISPFCMPLLLDGFLGGGVNRWVQKREAHVSKLVAEGSSHSAELCEGDFAIQSGLQVSQIDAILPLPPSDETRKRDNDCGPFSALSSSGIQLDDAVEKDLSQKLSPLALNVEGRGIEDRASDVDEWENDDDVGFVSITMTKGEFLEVERQRLSEMEHEFQEDDDSAGSRSDEQAICAAVLHASEARNGDPPPIVNNEETPGVFEEASVVFPPLSTTDLTVSGDHANVIGHGDDAQIITAPVWPKQPHEFAFSQEEDGDDTQNEGIQSDANVLVAESDGDRAELGIAEKEVDNLEDQGESEDCEDSDDGDRRKETVYDCLELAIIHERNRTGFEPSKDFQASPGTMIAGRYQVQDCVGEAVFSTAFQCIDTHTGLHVCMKVIKNDKEYFDQSLDEIKLLRYLNTAGDADEQHIIQLLDYFYFKEHLFLVFELLRDDLYEFSNFNRESNGELYFTVERLRSIARQCLEALDFVHSLGIVHSDIKPENILIKSFSRCEVKIIDFGSSFFITDHHTSYVQSRAYRAPEVILGLPYDYSIDIWSLGCVLCELWTGNVLFGSDSVIGLLAKITSVFGPFPESMLSKARNVNQFFTSSHILYEIEEGEDDVTLFFPKKTSFRHRVRSDDGLFVDFLEQLLQLDPSLRPTAGQILKHPWLKMGSPAE